MIPIFVYGTLKQGHGNNVLLQGISSFEGAALTVEKYPLFNFGIPGLFDITEDIKGRNIFGEIFHIENDEDIEAIDSLEGHPNLYERKIIQVARFDGSIHDVWCYFLDESVYRRTLDQYPNPHYLDYF